MRFLRHSITGLFLLGAAVALMLFAAQLVVSAVQERLAQEPRERPARERVFAVNVVTAELATVVPELEAFGRIKSRRTLELRAAVPGRIVWLSDNFQEGGRVKAGDVLAEIDKADAQAALARAEASMMEAQSTLRDAERAFTLAQDELETTKAQADLRQRAFDRQASLRDRGVGTEALVEAAELAAVQARQSVITRRQAVSQAQARTDQATLQIARSQIALDDAQRDLSDTTVIAPFSGTLQGVSLVEGRLVASNEMLAELVDPDQLEVAFRVSTVQYARLLDVDGALREAPCSITLDASGAGLSVPGQVSRASGAAGNGQTGRLLYARLDSAKGFKPEDFVTVTVSEPALERVTQLPASALDAGNRVLILGPEGRLEVRPVILLRRQGDDVLVRAEGLAGRQVVAKRTPLLGEGIKVRPLNPDRAELAPAMIELSAERRQKLQALVRDNGRMPEATKARVLDQLAKAKVPASLVDRLEQRAGG
jgi:RND family efflux transporter MFP subunit